jgi:hypothetical protein
VFLAIAPETVKSHVKHIFIKLGAEKRAQAVARASELGACDHALIVLEVAIRCSVRPVVFSLQVTETPDAIFIEYIEGDGAAKLKVTNQRQPAIIQHNPIAAESDSNDRVILIGPHVVDNHELHILFAKTGFQ